MATDKKGGLGFGGSGFWRFPCVFNSRDEQCIVTLNLQAVASEIRRGRAPGLFRCLFCLAAGRPTVQTSLHPEAVDPTPSLERYAPSPRP